MVYMASDMPIENRRRFHMRLSIATALLSIASFAPAASADTTYYNQRPRYHRTVYRGHHHIRRTVRRVAIGAAGGAAIGAIAGGGPGAAIGAIAGGGAGAIYDHHEKTKGN
jgi:outer membrane lipoprotein SlyB